MTFDFTGKRAVVCGGSRGIGRSIALGFAAAGAAVSGSSIPLMSDGWPPPQKWESPPTSDEKPP